MGSAPDVLVLGAGGVLGEAWMMGLLSGLEDGSGADLRRCGYFVGTSAGSIVAAHLAAGHAPRRPRQVDTETELAVARRPDSLITMLALQAARHAGAFAVTAGATLAPLALGVAAPGSAALRAALLRGLPRPRHSLDHLRAAIGPDASFDGRLRVVAVDRASGRRVVFGAPRAPMATVAEAVVASCTVPWLYAPVSIQGREYVDGGVWSPSNLDVAPAGRDTQVLCLNPTASIVGTHTLIDVVRNVVRTAVSVEALALRRRGAVVRTVAPNAECAAAMGVNFMDPEPRQHVLAGGYRQGLALAQPDASAAM